MSIPPLPGNPPQKSCMRRLLIVAAWLVGAFLLVLYVVPPSSWLIPSEPMVRGSSGMFAFSFPEIEPRWLWLSWRGWIAVPALKEALREGNPYARMGAARLLGARRDPRLLPDLEAALVRGGDEGVQWQSASAIVKIGGPQAIETMEHVARGMSTSRQIAVSALGHLEDKGAVPFLLEMLKNGKDTRMKGEVILALSRILHVDLGIPANEGGYMVDLAKHGPIVQKAAEEYVAAHPTR